MNRNFLIILMAIFAISAVCTSAYAQTAFFAKVDWNAAGHVADTEITLTVETFDNFQIMLDQESMIDNSHSAGVTTWKANFDPDDDAVTWRVVLDVTIGDHVFDPTILVDGDDVDEVLDNHLDDFFWDED